MNSNKPGPDDTTDRGAPVIGMVFAYLALLFLLSAFSAPGHAQVMRAQATDLDFPRAGVAVRLETLTVMPSPEDLPPPVKGRWERFEEALNAGPSRRHRVTETVTNAGVRTSCYQPCSQNCCVSSGEFSLAGRGLGR